MRWENRGHEFDSVAQRICAEDVCLEYYVYGAGVFGMAFVDLFKDEIAIKGFIDDSAEKQGKRINGLIVHPLDGLPEQGKESAIILVASSQTRRLYEKLNKSGWKRAETYFHIDEFTAIYMMYRYDKVYLPDIVYTITEKCTLRCRNCNAFIPDIPDKKDHPMEMICRDLDAYFKWVDFTNVVGLMGGDAMVHPHFHDILGYICETYYPRQIGNIEVYGNAVIVPDEATLRMMERYDVIYRFTDYRPYTTGKQKIEEITGILDARGIRYDHIRLSSWWDCGYPQESNGIHGDQELRDYFDACDRHACHNLSSRGILFCGMALCADRVGYCSADQDDFFDVSVYEADKRKELIEFYLGYSQKGYLAYCQKCNGSVNVNDRLIKAGEQI